LSKAAKSALTGPKGDTGAKGEAGSFPTTLPTGKSVSGYMTIFSEAADIESNSASFAFPLTAAPTTHFIEGGDPTPAGCEGTKENPGADSGNLCVFEIESSNVAFAGINGPGGDGTADSRGFALFMRPTNAANLAYVKVRWVVTG
jgi:hypothetical protein